MTLQHFWIYFEDGVSRIYSRKGCKVSKRVVKDDTKVFERNNCNVGVAFTYTDEAAEKALLRTKLYRSMDIQV